MPATVVPGGFNFGRISMTGHDSRQMAGCKDPAVSRSRGISTLCYIAERDMPTLGQHYTREEIAAEHGGGTLEFLPTVAGKVVCACLRTDPEYNPEAPNVILPGRGREIEYSAKLLIQQGGPIPVYLMRAPDAWEFVGLYVVENSTHFKADITHYELQTGRKVTSAIFMREVQK